MNKKTIRILASSAISIAISLVLTLAMTAVNFVTATTMDHPLFATAYAGGEVTTWIGAGISFDRYYPFTYEGDTRNYLEYSIEFNLASFLKTWLILFVIVLCVYWLIAYIRSKNKHNAETDSSDSSAQLNGERKERIAKRTKVSLISAGISLAATLIMMAVNYVTYLIFERPLLSLEFNDYLITKWIGAGIEHYVYYPLGSSHKTDHYYLGEVSFHLGSFLATWLILFVIVLLVFYFRRRIREKKNIESVSDTK